MTAGEGWTDVASLDRDQLNSDLVAGEPTVDIAIHFPDNFDARHTEKLTFQLMVDGFVHAKRVFADAGVQVRLAAARTGHLDPALFEVHSTMPGDGLPGPRFTNMYIGAERRPARLSHEALAAFESIVPDEPGTDRVVHLVALQDVYMTFYEQLDFRTWQPKTISTGGLSFPGYMYGATIPRHLRGVISITDLTKDANSWKTIAHELGHKLMNVSHEYRDMGPQHEVRSDEGLMFYGSGTEIPSGPEGRYHHERLHRSPHIYREAADGSRTWNPDYEAGGFYHDPIYEGISVDLDAEASQQTD